MDRNDMDRIVETVVKRYQERCAPAGIPLEASARHVHLSAAAMERLFGRESGLAVVRELSQPGEFLSDKRVRIVTPGGEISNVAVVGPLRDKVQVELSITDCRRLGISAPVNLSGDLRGAADVFLVGCRGMVEAPGSAIVPKAHIHLRPAEAGRMGLSHGQQVDVRLRSARPITLEGVVVRVSESFSPALHIDHDEANACAMDENTQAYLLGVSSPSEEGPKAVSLADPGRPLVRESVFPGKVVTEAAARLLVAQGAGETICLPRGVVITPSGKDVFNQGGKTVVWVE